MTSRSIVGDFRQTQHSRAIHHSPVFYGWVVWAVATLGIIASAPGQAFTISLFIDHYIEEFAIGRTWISMLFGVGTFVAALSITWIGKRIDQHGSRKIGVLIIIVFSLVLMSLAHISGIVTLFLSFVAIRLLGQGSMILVSTTAIAQWWRFRRGWVMGLALVAFALFQSGYLRVLEGWIETQGWRQTWIILGIWVGVVMLPLWALLMRDRPEKYGLQPDAVVDPEGALTDSSEAAAEYNYTLVQARQTRIFWVFLFGRVFAALWGTGLTFHQVSIFAELGHSKTAVAATYGILAIINAAATLAIGRYLIIRIRPGYIMAAQIVLMAVLLLLVMHMQAAWMLYPYALLFGVVMALGSSFDGSVWANVFGRTHIGAVRGFAYTGLIMGTSLGPIMFGFSFDYFGSYSPVLWLGILIACVPLTLALTTPLPTPPETEAL